MTIEQIEETIAECKGMASEDVFDLEQGCFVKQVDHKHYSQLLEELLRMALIHVPWTK